MFSAISLLLLTISTVLISAQTIPGDRAVAIHPNGDSTKCLDVPGAIFFDGAPVQIFDCNLSNAQTWSLFRGPTTVQVHGTNFCLDAGTTPGNNVRMKIWTCFPGLAAQSWSYTTDNRIAVVGQGQCLDLANGNHSSGAPVQTFQCTNFNTNQVWNVDV